MLRARYLVGVVALAATYYGGAKIGYELEFAGPVAAILWLPVGIGIAWLYLGGLRFWPGVLLGDLLANDYHTLPVGSALGQTTGNVLEVIVATLLLRRLVRRGSPLDSLVNVGGMLAAIAVGVTISATVGTLVTWLGGVTSTGDITTVWRTWFLADLCGGMVVVALAVAWRRLPEREWWRSRGPEVGLMLLCVAGLSELAFHTDRPLTYIVFPALVWAALRTGPRGASLAIAVGVGFTAWNTNHYLGPFIFDSVTRSALETQLYVAAATFMTLCLAAAVSERERFAAELGASRVRLVETADTARRRIERELHDRTQQRLIVLAAHLGIAARQVREAPEEAADHLEHAHRDLMDAIGELREIAHDIHPAVLSDLGLARAIMSVATRSTVPIRVLEVPTVRLDSTTEATAYYVVAEAVHNAQKYAHASSIQVRAATAPRSLRIDIIDNGVGGADADAGSGLRGLRARVEAVGGTFHLDSPAGRGTRLVVAIPAAPLQAGSGGDGRVTPNG
jgi:signal transduction histidine kinase